MGALTIILIKPTKTIITKCTEPHFDHTTRIINYHYVKVLSDSINFKHKFKKKQRTKQKKQNKTENTKNKTKHNKTIQNKTSKQTPTAT